ncbi:GNAT family N-acetyltransferase [Arthrobacter sp. MYb227]|uniref:GNAT family N-acetyltransferase n=1 Tax=Arthrobacter sp. MYb227 TaxID=1848601 RepID=UPI000CFAEF77|nr:GNAT family N-acetyltransferase [Arthrobacter sp. MYb227]PQZ95774.1 GNAT family N-acetyltransferase [Arthrobacter sp. MYb227]
MKQDSRFAKPNALDETMSRGWRALSEQPVDGGVARFSHGVTKRANSVLPLSEPSDVLGTLVEVENLYEARGLPTVFQISDDSLPQNLDKVLAARGYLADSPTLVQYLALDGEAHDEDDDQRLIFSNQPSPAWLETFWNVEGPRLAAEQSISVQILTNTEAIYASLIHENIVVAVARLALVGELGGIYCVVTREHFRSRGYARALLLGLIKEAARHKLSGLWLQVTALNDVARGLYESLGFETVSRYHYRVQPRQDS